MTYLSYTSAPQRAFDSYVRVRRTRSVGVSIGGLIKRYESVDAVLLLVGISHKYFKTGLVACGPYFLFIFIFINVRKQLLTFKLRF